MKTFLILSVLSFVSCSYAETPLHPRGCIYIDGTCDTECEVGTHSYSSGCDYLDPEPTCDNPFPEKDTTAMICDFSACYCDPPTVRNQVTGKCVPLEECPQTNNYELMKLFII